MLQENAKSEVFILVGNGNAPCWAGICKHIRYGGIDYRESNIIGRELRFNENNAMEAVEKLEVTGYSQADAKNSAWSKQWLIQGTGKPWM